MYDNIFRLFIFRYGNIFKEVKYDKQSKIFMYICHKPDMSRICYDTIYKGMI